MGDIVNAPNAPSEGPSGEALIPQQNKEAAGSEWQAPPAPVVVGGIQVVSPTSGDKYIVKVNGIQKLMTKAEIEAAGGKVPVAMEEASIIHQVTVKEGRAAGEEKELELAAAKIGLTAEELKKMPSGDLNTALQQFAAKYGMSIEAAVETYNKWKLNPKAPEYDNFNRWIVRDFQNAEEFALPQVAQSIGWERLNAATERNPNIVRTEFINGQQVNVINLEEAAKTGVDAATLSLAGMATIPTLVKANASDPGTMFQRGQWAITQTNLNAIKNAEKSRLAAEAELRAAQQAESDRVEAVRHIKNVVPDMIHEVTDELGRVYDAINLDTLAETLPKWLEANNFSLDSRKLAVAAGILPNIVNNAALVVQKFQQMGVTDLTKVTYQTIADAINKHVLNGSAIDDFFGAGTSAAALARQTVIKQLDNLGLYEGALKPGQYGPIVPESQRRYNVGEALLSNIDVDKLKLVFGDYVDTVQQALGPAITAFEADLKTKYPDLVQTYLTKGYNAVKDIIAARDTASPPAPTGATLKEQFESEPWQRQMDFMIAAGYPAWPGAGSTSRAFDILDPTQQAEVLAYYQSRKKSLSLIDVAKGVPSALKHDIITGLKLTGADLSNLLDASRANLEESSTKYHAAVESKMRGISEWGGTTFEGTAGAKKVAAMAADYLLNFGSAVTGAFALMLASLALNPTPTHLKEIGAGIISGFTTLPSSFLALRPSSTPYDYATFGTQVALDAMLLKGAKDITVAGGRLALSKLPKAPVVEAAEQAAILDRVTQIQKDFIDARIIRDPAEVAKAQTLYNGMKERIMDYSATSLQLKQIQKAISDIGLAKNPSELRLLEQLKLKANDLTTKLETQRAPLEKSISDFSDTLSSNMRIDDPAVLREIAEMPKVLRQQLDSITTELVSPRTSSAIAKDIADIGSQIHSLEGQLNNIDIVQLADYRNLISRLGNELKSLNQEARLRYLATGENPVTNEITSLQQRLIDANTAIANFQESVLNPSTFRKGELIAEIDKATAERDIFEAVQKVYEPIWGKESYGAALDKLNGTLDNLISLLRRVDRAPDRIIFEGLDTVKAAAKGDIKALNAGIERLRLATSELPKPLQIQAGEQIKLLGTYADDLMRQWRYREASIRPSTPSETSPLVDYEAVRIGQEAQRVIDLRFEKLTDRLPDTIRSRSSAEIMDYLRERYDPAYFERQFDGLYRDLDDFLDIERVKAEIRAAADKEAQAARDLRTHEIEKEATDRFKDKVTDPRRKDALEKHSEELQRQIEQKKAAIKVATKEATRLEPLIQKARSLEGRVSPEETLTRTEKTAKEVSREKIAREISKAKEDLAREAGKPSRPSVFPGISPKVKVVSADGRTSEVPAEHIGAMTPEQAQRLYGDRFKIIDARSPYRITDTGEIVAEWLSPADAIARAQQIQITAAFQEAVKAGQQAYDKTQDMVALQEAVATSLKQSIQTSTTQAVKTSLALQLQPAVQTATQTIITPATTTTTTIKEPPPAPKPYPILTSSKTHGLEEVDIPPGSLAWRQGKPFGKQQIKYIPPPYNQLKPVSLIGKIPRGWVDKGRTPAETIQIIGEARDIPARISVDLGIADVWVLNGREIEFKGGGLKTNVGTRIESNTQGMSIPAAGEREQGLKFGSDFEDALLRIPRDKAQADFQNARLLEMISGMSSAEIASRLRAINLGIDDSRVQFILAHMPDMAEKELRQRLEATLEDIKLGPEQRVVTRFTLSRPKPTISASATAAEQAAELGEKTVGRKRKATIGTRVSLNPATATSRATKPEISTVRPNIGDIMEWL